MLKLRKPFSRKVQLHIRQDLLQKLWDKYVPENSAEYGRIELIYLDAGREYMGGEPRQIQLLINLILRNRIMQAGLSGSGGTLAAAAGKMEGSVLRAEKCFLTQLRCYDVRLYRAVKRYVTLLEQFREEGRRYQSWQRENRMIERQRTEYRLFSAFSSDIKNFLAERSVEVLREMERELIRVLPEGEYRILARQIPNLTEPKEFMLQYLDVMEVEEIRQLWEQLEEISQEAHGKTGEAIRQPQQQIEEMNPWDTGGMFREIIAELRRRYAHEVARDFYKRAFSILNTEPYQMLSEPYREIVDMVLRPEPYQETADMVSRPEPYQETADMVLSSEETADMVFSSEPHQETADMVLGSRPYQETVDMVLNSEETADMVFSSEPYQKMADMVDVMEETEGPLHEIRCIMDSVQMKLEAQKEQIWQHEAKVYETYGELYREALKEKNITMRQTVGRFPKGTSEKEISEDVVEFLKGISEEEVRKVLEWLPKGVSEEEVRKDARQSVEETFRNQHQGEIGKEELRDICEWGRVFAELFANPIPEKQKFKAVSSKTEESRASAGHAVWHDMAYHEEWVYLTQEVSRYMEEHDMETFLRVWRENVMNSEPKDQRLWNLLERLHVLDKERREDFVKNLSDMIHIWIRASSFGQYEGTEARRTEIETKTVWQTVREAFLGQCQTEMDEVEFRRLCQWSRALTDLVTKVFPEIELAETHESQGISGEEIEDEARDYGEMAYLVEEIHRNGEEVEDKAGDYGEMAYLVEEIHRNLEEKGQGTFSKVQQEQVIQNGLKEGELRKLLERLHVLDKEKRTEFVRNLSDSIHIWNQLSPFRQQKETEAETRPVDVPFQKLWEWGEALRNISDHDDGEKESQEEAPLPEENELRELIAQINHALHPGEVLPITTNSFEEDGKGKVFRLVYTDTRFHSRPIQSLLRYARELNEEQYESLLGELSKITQIQWRLAQGQGMEQEAEQELRQILVQRNRELFQSGDQRRQPGLEETDTVHVPYLRMWEWGEALLFCPEYVQNADDDSQEIIEEKEALPEEKKRKQTQWIRRQIKEAKDRNNLQQLISQINHRLEISRKTEPGETKEDETIQLVYADSQLAVSAIQSLLHYIQNLDEEGYGVLVKELAQVTKVQSMLTSCVGLEEETAREVRQMFIRRKQSKTSPAQVWEWGKALRYYPEHEPLPQAQKERKVTPSTEEGEGQRRTHLIYTDDRNNLQQMIWQINRLTEAQQSTEMKIEKAERHSSGMRETDVPEGMSDFAKIRKPETEAGSEKHQKSEIVLNLETEQKTGNEWDLEEDQSRRVERGFRLVYVPSKLKSPSVHDLLDYIRYLNKEQYEILIEELTKVTRIQQRLEEAGTRTKLADIGQRIARDFQELPDEEKLPYKKSLTDMGSLPEIQNLLETKDLPDVRNLSGQARHGIDYARHGYRESYLELAHCIRQYEIQRRQTMKKDLRQNLRQIQESYSYPNPSGRIRKDIENIADVVHMIDIIDMAVTSETEDGAEISYLGRNASPGAEYSGIPPLSLEIRKENKSMTAMDSPEREWRQPERAGQPSGRARQSLSQGPHGFPSQELAYSIQAADSSRDEQQRTGLRLQEENLQIKSVQEQLGKKLTEVEEQLKAVEGSSRAKQDVRSLTDQIKRQLYEELHVEKLRRGLI